MAGERVSLPSIILAQLRRTVVRLLKTSAIAIFTRPGGARTSPQRLRPAQGIRRPMLDILATATRANVAEARMAGVTQTTDLKSAPLPAPPPARNRFFLNGGSALYREIFWPTVSANSATAWPRP
jgi:hypothetical protein